MDFSTGTRCIDLILHPVLANHPGVKKNADAEKYGCLQCEDADGGGYGLPVAAIVQHLPQGFLALANALGS